MIPSMPHDDESFDNGEAICLARLGLI